MATATKNGRVVPQGRAKPVAASLAFLVYQDNGGDHHWEIVDHVGQRLAHSGSFSSQDDAEHAARFVYEGASSARFGPNLPAGDRIEPVR